MFAALWAGSTGLTPHAELGKLRQGARPKRSLLRGLLRTILQCRWVVKSLKVKIGQCIFHQIMCYAPSAETFRALDPIALPNEGSSSTRWCGEESCSSIPRICQKPRKINHIPYKRCLRKAQLLKNHPTSVCKTRIQFCTNLPGFFIDFSCARLVALGQKGPFSMFKALNGGHEQLDIAVGHDLYGSTLGCLHPAGFRSFFWTR